jgi:hypothetical protein
MGMRKEKEPSLGGGVKNEKWKMKNGLMLILHFSFPNSHFSIPNLPRRLTLSLGSIYSAALRSGIHGDRRR